MKLVKSTIKEFLKLIILSTVCFVVALQAPYIHRDYIRNIAETSVVQIYGQEGTGTGAHIELPNGKIVILTNKHICSMTGPLMVKAVDKKLKIARQIIKISEKHDLCVIEGIPGEVGIKIGDAPEFGDELYTLGHPRGDALNVARGEYFDDKEIKMLGEFDKEGRCSGKIEQVESFFGVEEVCVESFSTFQISTPTYPGNSGSPIVNKYGNLVGVVFAGSREIENMGFAVPYTYVIDFLSTIK